jgi:hypothetical protein
LQHILRGLVHWQGRAVTTPAHLLCSAGIASREPPKPLPDHQARLLLHAFLPSASQTSQEVHTARLDALEDRLIGKETGSAQALADKNNAWQEQRHR